MIRINLLPLKETQRAIGQRQQVSVALLSLSVAILFMVIPYVIQGRRLARLDDQIDTLQREITQLNEQTKEASDLDRKKGELQAKLRVIDDLNLKRVGPLHVLEALSTTTPEKLWLVDFNESRGNATINGVALDNQTVAQFLRQLGESPYFVNVDLVETGANPATGSLADVAGAGMKRFIIRAGIDYFGRAGKSDAAPNGAEPKAPAAPGKRP
jgi:type IV pilus assembly protein PilN